MSTDRSVTKKYKDFGLSIKGGAARGFGSIGLIRFLQEERLQPKILAGSSSGAILAAMYAVGYEWDEMMKLIVDIRVASLLSLKAFMAGSLVSAQKLLEIFQAYTEERNIEDLPIQLLIFASDPVTSERVIIEKGNLAEALLASCSYPLLLPSAKVEDRILIDGDFTNSFSAAELKTRGVELVLGSHYTNKKTESFVNNSPIQRIFDVYRLLMTQIERHNDVLNPIDYELTFYAGDYNYLDFDHFDKLVDRAYRRVRRDRKKIHSLLKIK